MKLSICIPTYNRSDSLLNCLESIGRNKKLCDLPYQVCISDNASEDNTYEVVLEAKKNINIKYFRFNENVGIVKNFINVVDMAAGEFIWLVGDDDLLLPDAIYTVVDLIEANKNVDFFYINSYCLSSKYVFSFDQPFNIDNVPNDMDLFSSYKRDGVMKFIDLISPEVSKDFVSGIFLSVFRRVNWIENVSAINKHALNDNRVFSCFDNTFPHVKIFTRAFTESDAFFCSTPLTVNLSGVREWAPMSPLINNVRLIEGLVEYRRNGLSLIQYLKCRNFALRGFIPDYVRMVLNKSGSGYVYVRHMNLFLSNMLYPNVYLSLFYYFRDKLNSYIEGVFR